MEIDSPPQMLTTLGIDAVKLAKTTQDLEFYDRLDLHTGVFFDQETFGADKLIVGLDRIPFKELLEQAPLSARARRRCGDRSREPCATRSRHEPSY